MNAMIESKKYILTPVLLVMILGTACQSDNKTQSKTDALKEDVAHTEVPATHMGPAMVVYKTKGDYINLVPVTLSDDKETIISFPDPADISQGTVPMRLSDGYLKDNKGVNKNTAFLKMTYDEYAALAEVPSMEDLQSAIIDKDPITELYDCGYHLDDESEQEMLNKIITNSILKGTCTVLK